MTSLALVIIMLTQNERIAGRDCAGSRPERNTGVGRFSTFLKRVITQTGTAPSPAAIQDLKVRDAYWLWAPTYAVETAVSALDEQLAGKMLSGLPKKRLLDAGCGTGRRMQNIPDAVGIDLSPEMLAVGNVNNVIVGDVRTMPFESNRFDMVWCRLVLGHLPDPLRAYRELCRVCMPGGYVFVTDFHPDAAAAGHRRTVSGEKTAVYAIEHYVHDHHIQFAEETGLHFVDHRAGIVGPSIREFYHRGIGLKAYKRDIGLKLVAAFLFRKPDAAGKHLASSALSQNAASWGAFPCDGSAAIASMPANDQEDAGRI